MLACCLWGLVFIQALFKLVLGTGTGPSVFQEPKPSFVGGNLINNTERMIKDLSDVIEVAFDNIDIKHMEFYYFRLHDTNNDQHLDGNELFLALQESPLNLDGDLSQSDLQQTENYFASATDALLAEADENDDGLISWEKYLAKTRSFFDS